MFSYIFHSSSATRRRVFTGVSLAAVFAVLVLAVAVGTGCSSKEQKGILYHCPMHPTYVLDRPGDCPICGMRLVPTKQGGESGTSSTGTSSPAPAGGVGSAGRNGGATESAGAVPPGVTVYLCPMESDSEVVALAPGECPLCGMDLVPAATLPDRTIPPAALNAAVEEYRRQSTRPPGRGPDAASSQGRILYYRSPMDPRVTSPVPAKDDMGMDFIAVHEDEAQGGTPGQPDIPGRAPVTMTEQGEKLAGLRTTPALRGVHRRTVRAVGIVQPDERRIHQVTLKSEGYVVRLLVATTGQLVGKGDPILSIYSPDLYAAQAEYLNARRVARELAASDMAEVQSSAEDLLQAAKRRLELLDVPPALIRKIEETGSPERDVTFNAPVSGYVTAKQVVAGMRVEPGQELYTVVDLSRVWIEANFYPSEVAYLDVGQLAVLTLPYDTSLRLTARVALIYPGVDPGTRTLRVRFETENPGLELKPGMYANAEVAIQSDEGILVPDNAVLDTGTRQLVYVQTAPGEYSPRAVRVGLRGDGQALLLEGVREGESVVVQANFLLDSESRIRAAISGAAR